MMPWYSAALFSWSLALMLHDRVGPSMVPLGRLTLAVVTVCLSLYIFGNVLFALVGITVDAFRVGAGALLFLSAVSLVRGQEFQVAAAEKADIAVLPLAIPIAIGPATTGALLIMGADVQSTGQRIAGGAALCLAGLAVGLIPAYGLERLMRAVVFASR